MGELSFQFLSIIIAITIPMLFVAFLLGNSDSRRIVLFFCWGLFAGALAFVINSHIASAPGQSERLSLSIAPIVEEVCKGLPLLLFLNKRRFPQVTKVIVFCAMVSGVGFSVQESMYYFSESSREISDVAMLVVRSLTTSLMHGMTTAAVGIGLLLFNKHKHIIVLIVFAFFALSASAHALFNLLLQTKWSFVAAIMPIAMFVAGRMFIRNYCSCEGD